MLTSGQDLQCVACKRRAYLLDTRSKKGKIDKENFFNSAPLMRCSKCRALLHHSKFDENMKDNWVSVADDARAVVCINCLRGHYHHKRQQISSCTVINVLDEETTFPQTGQRELSLQKTCPTGTCTRHL